MAANSPPSCARGRAPGRHLTASAPSHSRPTLATWPETRATSSWPHAIAQGMSLARVSVTPSATKRTGQNPLKVQPKSCRGH